MAEMRISNLERDGEHRQFAAHGHAELGSAGGTTFLRGVFEPGWRWSQDVKPIAGTDSCQTHHRGYTVSGSMTVRSNDGTEITYAEGDLFDIPPGHDAWVNGDVPCVMVDASPDAAKYARSADLAPAEDDNMKLVRRGYEAFNTGDMATLRELLAYDVVQHVPGKSQLSGTYKGLDAVLAYYGKIAELTGGQYSADLLEVHGDGEGHVIAVHQSTGTRNGQTRVARQSIFFTFLGGKATDLLELRADLAGDDAFFA
ncbi:MAG TPA: nuclear transport factor 2 family protein [Jatrophihabitantaceae bacterium]|jgi:ketosteroid isomerase-like protein|nr:nuclear transport factor 2 family protein [Jatrophihabitantaceae bacterium]